jgi:hypothetical protein
VNPKPMLAAALAAAKRGWQVFPVKPRGKVPLTKRGLHDATRDTERIVDWWRRRPDANVAVRTGRESSLFVLDVDGDEGHDSLHQLERDHGPLPETVSATTGGGGEHLFFRHPGRPVPCSAGRLGPGLDIRGEGGYVVLAPSVHESGRRYTWDRAPGEAPLAAAPAWLVERARGRDRDRRNGPAPPVAEKIREGGRNGALTSLAGSMRRRGMDEPEIRAALLEANRRRCEPALDEREVARIAASVARYEPAQPATNGDRRSPQPSVARERAPAAGSDGRGVEVGGTDGPLEPERPFALELREFVADKQEAREPLLGTEDDCILPAHGLGMLIAKGGKGKTTFGVDFVLHAASGIDYLGLTISRPLNVLFIENEGPREPFRRKLERRLEHWGHDIRGGVYVYDQDWGHARLDLEGFVERLNAFCEERDIDLVVGDPLDSLGMDGEGSPSETRAMVDRFKAAGLFSSRAWFLPHHSRKESVDDAVDEASGAWGGRADTMLALEKRKDNQARLSFSKVRWQGRDRKPYLLDFDPEMESFTFVKEEEGEERDYTVEVEEFLAREPPRTVGEIAEGIGAGKEKVKAALGRHPDRFDSLTGERAKALGRHANATLWRLASASGPDNPDTLFQGVPS